MQAHVNAKKKNMNIAFMQAHVNAKKTKELVCESTNQQRIGSIEIGTMAKGITMGEKNFIRK